MAALPNLKHERFAEAFENGAEIKEAAKQAGIEIKACTDLSLFYVYALVDPRDGSLFYIGKGTGKRYAQHWQDALRGRGHNRQKAERLRDIAAAGYRVEEVCIADGLSEPASLRLERRLIAAVGYKRLTNKMAGNISPLERDVAESRYWADRIMPFEDWMLRGERTLKEVELYFHISLSLYELAIEGEKRLAA